MFTDDLEEMTRWVTELDHSFVAIQGPPGAGKTHNAAHLIYASITAGKRVGITATSHVAIDELLQKVITVFSEHGRLDDLRAVHKPAEGAASPGVTRCNDNAAVRGPTSIWSPERLALRAQTPWQTNPSTCWSSTRPASCHWQTRLPHPERLET